MKRILAGVLAGLFLFPTSVAASTQGCISKASVHVMPPRYWDLVAICESSQDGETANWQDRGNWAGGLGIARGTWNRYGGRQFAATPDKATREEQIIVANRISVLGFTYKDGYYKWPVGFFGWGCIKNRSSLHPRKWEHAARKQKRCPN